MFEIISAPVWPDEIPKRKILCAGEAFLNYMQLAENPPNLEKPIEDEEGKEGKLSNSKQKSKSSNLDLFNAPKPLEEYSYYEILSLPMHATQNQVRSAYHKSSLKYHPDKNTNPKGNKEAVFLRVKEAFDTLGDIDKRRAYDSSLDFDESIPSKEYTTDKDFFEAFGSCFERNLRFANPQKNYPDPSKILLGDNDTPIEDVHRFYDYWTNFESWRDFSLVASQILKHDTDLADGRDEKRWMEKEIGRKAKALKREEMSRITTLVERAMSMDPRLRRERDLEKLRKRQLAAEKKKAKEEAERKKKEEEERKILEEKQKKEHEKKEKEKKKSVAKKLRQSFRRAMESAYQLDTNSTWETMEQMKEDAEFLCQNLSYQELSKLNEELVPDNYSIESPNPKALPQILKAYQEKKETPNKTITQAPKNTKPKQTTAKPWTKEELSALAKGIKKYPAGLTTRWDNISSYIMTIAKTKRTKEECIAQYNSISSTPNKSAPLRQQSTASTDDTGWTDEQDQQLQQGLSKFPASMDKNERWTSIAKGVTGKSKKQCVERFKAIREAIKAKQ